MKTITIHENLWPMIIDLDLNGKNIIKETSDMIDFSDNDNLDYCYRVYKNKSAAEKEILDRYSYQLASLEQNTKNALEQLKKIEC